LGALKLLCLWMGGVADPKIYAPPHMCYHVKIGSYATKSERIKRKEPQNVGSAGTPLWDGCLADLLQTDRRTPADSKDRAYA